MAKIYRSKDKGALKWKSVLKNFGIEVFYSSQKDEFSIIAIAEDFDGNRAKLQPEDLNETQLKALQKVIEKNQRKK